MKITKKYLQNIIEEERKKVLNEQYEEVIADLVRFEQPEEMLLHEMTQAFVKFDKGHFGEVARDKSFGDGWSIAYRRCLDTLENLRELATKGVQKSKLGKAEWNDRYECVQAAAKIKRELFVDPTGGRWFHSTAGSEYGNEKVPRPATSARGGFDDREPNSNVGSYSTEAEPGNPIEVAKQGNVGEVIRLMVQSGAICKDRYKNYRRKSRRTAHMRKPATNWPCRKGGSVLGLSTSNAEADKRNVRITTLRKISKYIISLIDRSQKIMKEKKPIKPEQSATGRPKKPLSLADKSDFENINEGILEDTIDQADSIIMDLLNQNGFRTPGFMEKLVEIIETQANKSNELGIDIVEDELEKFDGALDEISDKISRRLLTYFPRTAEDAAIRARNQGPAALGETKGANARARAVEGNKRCLQRILEEETRALIKEQAMVGALDHLTSPEKWSKKGKLDRDEGDLTLPEPELAKEDPTWGEVYPWIKETGCGEGQDAVSQRAFKLIKKYEGAVFPPVVRRQVQQRWSPTPPRNILIMRMAACLARNPDSPYVEHQDRLGLGKWKNFGFDAEGVVDEIMRDFPQDGQREAYKAWTLILRGLQLRNDH